MCLTGLRPEGLNQSYQVNFCGTSSNTTMLAKKTSTIIRYLHFMNSYRMTKTIKKSLMFNKTIAQNVPSTNYKFESFQLLPSC